MFGKRLNSDEGMFEEVLNRMLIKKDEENTLAQEVNDANLGRKTRPFETVTSEDILDFPEITERELKLFFTGSYQYTQAICYLAQFLDEDS